MTPDYKSLISATRRRQSSEKENRDINQESESDRARFVFSSPLRRLQQKAQVYSLEDNAAVRSRLTHSLEVSQLGRYISQLILKKLKSNTGEPRPENCEVAFVNFVETACLMHDVGNPPFGHLGEYAIQEWFNEKGKKNIEKAGIDYDKYQGKADIYLSEFKEFDGNCQGFRIVTRLQWNDDEYGLNLTYSQLASYLKYVTHQSGIDKNNEIKKKGGYFLTEEEIIKECWQELGMKENTRHPLVYIMEAADDIAYSISDIEDALEKGLIQLDKFLDSVLKTKGINNINASSFAKEVSELVTKIRQQMKNNHLSPFTNFRTALTRLFATYAAEKYIANHSKILNGTSMPIFSEKNDIEVLLLNEIKKFAICEVYSTAAASDNELAGYSILRGTLDHFETLISCKRHTFGSLCDLPKPKDDNSCKANKIQKRLFALLPKRYLKVYKNETQKLSLDDPLDHLKEWLYRAHLITDYISGMTDDYALETFQLLSGIKVGRTNLTK